MSSESFQKFPQAMYPYVYEAQIKRNIDGDSSKVNLSKGFGDWNLCTVYPGADKEAPYPQGVYRLYGINTPEVRGEEKPLGLQALARLDELCAQSSHKYGHVLAATHKERAHGKYRYMIEILVPVDPEPLGFEIESEKKAWLSKEDLEDLLEQTEEGEAGSSTIRALVTEVLARRREAGDGRVINANQVLLDEGLAEPYFGGAK